MKLDNEKFLFLPAAFSDLFQQCELETPAFMKNSNLSNSHDLFWVTKERAHFLMKYASSLEIDYAEAICQKIFRIHLDYPNALLIWIVSASSMEQLFKRMHLASSRNVFYTLEWISPQRFTLCVNITGNVFGNTPLTIVSGIAGIINSVIPDAKVGINVPCNLQSRFHALDSLPGCGTDTSQNGIVFDVSFTQDPAKIPISSNDLISSLLSGRSRFEYFDGEELLYQISQIIEKNLQNPNINIDMISSALNTTSRTLQRKLSDTGIGFRDILNLQRRNKAASLLRTEPDKNIIANKIGLSDERSLYRILKTT